MTHIFKFWSTHRFLFWSIWNYIIFFIITFAAETDDKLQMLHCRMAVQLENSYCYISNPDNHIRNIFSCLLASLKKRCAWFMAWRLFIALKWQMKYKLSIFTNKISIPHIMKPMNVWKLVVQCAISQTQFSADDIDL
jgi:hypothetical protein